MTTAEREAFLAGLHVGVLGLERRDGPPLVVPIWYSYEPGGDVVMLTSATSLKFRLASAAGRGSLVAQQETLPYKYVSVEGDVVIEPLGDDAHASALPMAVRYLGEELGAAYVASGTGVDQVRVRLTPQRWHTIDYSKMGA